MIPGVNVINVEVNEAGESGGGAPWAPEGRGHGG